MVLFIVRLHCTHLLTTIFTNRFHHLRYIIIFSPSFLTAASISNFQLLLLCVSSISLVSSFGIFCYCLIIIFLSDPHSCSKFFLFYPFFMTLHYNIYCCIICSQLFLHLNFFSDLQLNILVFANKPTIKTINYCNSLILQTFFRSYYYCILFQAGKRLLFTRWYIKQSPRSR